MESAIKVLPSHLIDKIAAGEVVERPASIVKELTENALDAGCQRLVCQVEQGGQTLIRVQDDGRGMNHQELALCIVRHATSKISRFDDLQQLTSLGFRGEALPSIASVSKLSIITRQPQDDAGSRLYVEGAKKPVIDSVGAPVGTQVQVADLFYNTPARLKFLRKPNTEFAHISSWITQLGLARPDVHFRLEHNGRKVIEAPVATELSMRVAALLGRQVYDHLHPIQYAEHDLSIQGLITDPGYSRQNTRGIYLFVNGRSIRDRSLQYAIMQGYRTVLPEGRFPLVVIKVELSPEKVDVNVHPQKTEVRFLDTRSVQVGLRAAIERTLSKTPWIKLPAQAVEAEPSVTYRLRQNDPSREAGNTDRVERVRLALGQFPRISQQPNTNPARPRQNNPTPQHTPAQLGSKTLQHYKVLGTLWDTYVALTEGDRLVLVDQHAAHERIVFEKLRSTNSTPVPSQQLLVGLQMEVEPALAAICEQETDKLNEIGFHIEPFGPAIINVSAVPALLAQSRVTELVTDVLEGLLEYQSLGAWEEQKLSVLSRMACHGSVRAGRTLTEAEIRTLLTQLEQIDFSGRCPHGRPVLVELQRSEVAHWFARS